MIEFDNRQEKMDFKDDLKKIIENAIKSVLNYEKFENSYEVSVVITDNAGIREINREFRNIDRETDVLSFPMLEYEEGYEENGEIEVEFDDLNPDGGEVVLGDVVISLEKAYEQSLEYGHSFQREVAFLTVHSMLHLLGYDHEEEDDRKIMREKEEEILANMNLTRE